MSDKAYLSEDFPHERYAIQSNLLPISDDDLILQRVYRWESQHADRVCMTQPLGGGQVKNYTWKEVMHEVRCMANYLKAQDFPAGSQIAVFRKKSARVWPSAAANPPFPQTHFPFLTQKQIDYATSIA